LKRDLLCFEAYAETKKEIYKAAKAMDMVDIFPARLQF
jgi:hypothetical protein